METADYIVFSGVHYSDLFCLEMGNVLFKINIVRFGFFFLLLNGNAIYTLNENVIVNVL